MPKGPFKRTLKWFPGDLFAIPLTDRTFGVAQAVAPVHSFAIDFALLTNRLVQAEKLVQLPTPIDAIGIGTTWRTAVTGGHWAHIGNCEPLLSLDFFPNQRRIASGDIQVTHSSWSLLEKFLSACHGIFPWNLYPAFDFDSYLIPGVRRPLNAKVLSAAEVSLARAMNEPDSNPM